MSESNGPVSTSGGDSLLSVDGVARDFGDLSVLEDVTFTVDPGSVTCIMGPNGSGKTTLLRIVAALLPPSDGTVTVSTGASRPVGYLPQRPAFRPRFTVAETISYYADIAGVTVDVDERLRRVGLQDVADRRVEALSGGMTRLLGIAQATVGDPPLYVLDEPSSGLDPVMVEHVSSVVGTLAADGAAVLLATHNVAAVEQMADRILVLHGGTVVSDAAPDVFVAESGESTLVAALATLVGREGADVSVSVGRRGEES